MMKICPFCQKIFIITEKRGNHKYCSIQCRRKGANYNTAAYHRKRDNILRSLVLELLGGKCKSCGISDNRVLQIDHINGNGYKENKILGYSGGNTHRYYRHILDVKGEGYQLLCANCNWIKRYEKKEYN